jgi:hypothetical protein
MLAKFGPSAASSYNLRSEMESQSMTNTSQHDPESQVNDGEETEPDEEQELNKSNSSHLPGRSRPATRKRSPEVELSPPPLKKQSISEWAYSAALGLDPDCADWKEFGGLTSVRKISFEL